MSPEDAVEIATPGGVSGGPASAALDSHLLEHAQRLAAQLCAALEMRAVVDQAIGVIMGQDGKTESEASEELRERSRVENEQLVTVAHGVVARAVHPTESHPTESHPTESHPTESRRHVD